MLLAPSSAVNTTLPMVVRISAREQVALPDKLSLRVRNRRARIPLIFRTSIWQPRPIVGDI